MNDDVIKESKVKSSEKDLTSDDSGRFDFASDVRVDVSTQFLPEQSKPERNQYAFGYSIRIFNDSQLPVQLLTRYWKITNEREEVREVQGKGVVGEQPIIAPGANYHYSSGAMLETPRGIMQGHYHMQSSKGHTFDVEVPVFALLPPGKLH